MKAKYRDDPAAYLREYRKKRPDVVRRIAFRYRQANLEKISEINRKRYYTVNGRFSAYKNGAKVRGIPMNLSKEEFSEFWQKPCWYCGREITTIGLDRINNGIGYQIGNVISCCVFCNRAKNCLSHKEFLEACHSISNRHPLPAYDRNTVLDPKKNRLSPRSDSRKAIASNRWKDS